MLKIVFMGTPMFAVPILEALISEYDVIAVITQPDKEVGRNKVLTASPVKECALKHGIKIFQPLKIRTDYQDIIDLKPDLIVTAAYGQIVGTKLLNAPVYRSINVHGSLLPLYRGGAPIQRSVMAGDKETGITIIYMEKGMDSGDILARKSMPILDNDTSGDVFNKLSLVGRDLIMETIPLLIEGKIEPEKQDETKVTFAYNLKKEEEELDFTKPAQQVYNHIRAFNPTPTCYMMFKGEPLKIYLAKVSNLTHDDECGKIINITKKTFCITCGDKTVLEILEVQPFGKKRMLASDFINGNLRKYL